MLWIVILSKHLSPLAPARAPNLAWTPQPLETTRALLRSLTPPWLRWFASTVLERAGGKLKVHFGTLPEDSTEYVAPPLPAFTPVWDDFLIFSRNRATEAGIL